MLVYAYTNYTGHQRDADWSIRTMGAYMSTDWRYGAAIKHKMALRTIENRSAKNFFFNFNHTNHFYYGQDSHLMFVWLFCFLDSQYFWIFLKAIGIWTLQLILKSDCILSVAHSQCLTISPTRKEIYLLLWWSNGENSSSSKQLIGGNILIMHISIWMDWLKSSRRLIHTGYKALYDNQILIKYLIFLVRLFGWISSRNRTKDKIARASYNVRILDFKFNNKILQIMW